MSKKTQNGGENINLGVCPSALGPSRPIRKLQQEATCSPGRAWCFWRKPPACRGELGSNLLPYFFYKWTLGAEEKRSNTFGNQISLKISEEKKKEGENQGQGASITLHDVSMINSANVLCRSSLFAIRSLIFNRLVFDFEALNSFYAPLGVHSCFVCFHLHLVFFWYSFPSF